MSRWLPLVIAALIVAGLLGWWWFRPIPSDTLLARSREALARGDETAARDLAAIVLERDPTSVPAIELWAEASWDAGNHEAAITRMHLVPDDAEGAAGLLAKAGKLAVRTGWPLVAEDCLSRSVALDPETSNVHAELAYLYGVTGRAYRMQRHLYEYIRREPADLHHLVMLAAGEPVIRDDVFVDRCLRARPKVPLVLLGRGRTAVFEDRAAEALPSLKRIVAAHPDVAEARARLGLALLEARPDGLPGWAEDLPDTARSHPDVRVVLALMARAAGNDATALGHLSRAVAASPDHRVAHYQLARVLEALGRTDEAIPFAERAEKLRQLAFVVDEAFSGVTPELIRRAAELTEELDRPWEARGWARLALNSEPPPSWAVRARDRLDPVLAGDPPRSKGPVPPETPDPEPTIVVDSVTPLPVDVAPRAIVFEETARATGLDFVYDTGRAQGDDVMRMYESFGGGVGVLDFDADGRPDVLLVQGGPFDPTSDGDAGERPSDRLFRNTRNGFDDVTDAAGLRETAYGNGVAVGDVDGDGFDDVYVAQMGRNRLWLNNGDGTFTEANGTGMTAAEWTTSAAIADLDGDGLADLYDVNYIEDSAARVRCEHGREMRLCGPNQFDAVPDRLWMNRGDGTFDDASTAAGIDLPNGKGLGLVVGNLDARIGLDVLVANDGTPNFLFLGRATDEGPRFVERGFVSGVAVDRDGFSQGCMGVAAGDVTGDGRSDLFVTNFADQSNTLYVSGEDGLFDDGTRRARLRVSGYEPLGFGTQFLDADLDGRLDLAIANGHLFEGDHLDLEYRQRPRFHRNVGSGAFTEVDDPALGRYFGTPLVGRGMARLDWNADGRDDLLVSNIGGPASLVTNRTPPAGTRLAIRLVAANSARDAIGTRVTVTSGSRRVTRQLHAGNGYQASNERIVTFGLSDRPTTVDVEIEWPDGRVTSAAELVTEHTWLISDDGRALELPSIHRSDRPTVSANGRGSP